MSGRITPEVDFCRADALFIGLFEAHNQGVSMLCHCVVQ